ncbi:MAG: hypothetical protein ACXVXL_31785 [Solirubrobacteraceae bacterium]
MSEPNAHRTTKSDQELVMYLERDQLVEQTGRPLPPAMLSRRARAGVWALRVLVMVLGAMVAYTFAWQLGH